MILALDISSSTGWALHSNNGVNHGTWELDISDWAQAHNEIEDCMEILCRKHPVRTVIVERPFGIGKQRDLMQWLLSGVHGVAWQLDIARHEVAPTQWRKALWGSGTWTTKAAKTAAMDWCRQQGFRPRNDNEADAICVLSWWLERRPDVLD